MVKAFDMAIVGSTHAGPLQGLKIWGGGLVILGGENVPPNWLR